MPEQHCRVEREPEPVDQMGNHRDLPADERAAGVSRVEPGPAAWDAAPARACVQFGDVPVEELACPGGDGGVLERAVACQCPDEVACGFRERAAGFAELRH